MSFENILLKRSSTYCLLTPSKGSVGSETPLKYNESPSVIYVFEIEFSCDKGLMELTPIRLGP